MKMRVEFEIDTKDSGIPEDEPQTPQEFIKNYLGLVLASQLRIRMENVKITKLTNYKF